MRIESYNKLDQELIKSIQVLEKVCQVTDGTHRDIYLDSDFNFDLQMPSSFLAWEDNQLIGFLSIYADQAEEAEVSVIVHPKYRLQGVAAALIERATKVKEQYQIQSFIFVSERHFIDNHPFIQEKLIEEADTLEILMRADSFDPSTIKESEVSIRIARPEDISEIALLQANAFDETYELSERYTRESLKSLENMVFVFLKHGEIVGSTAVNFTPTYYYLFSLAIHPGFQDQGVATDGIAQVMEALAQIEALRYQLSVEKTNLAARKLYAKNGFSEITEVVYLRSRY
ncbi:GNAT family N-acetyltransferase [Aerococcaceae bacterium WGS1372]